MGSLGLALFGFGTVGAQVASLLDEHRAAYREICNAELRLKWIVVRDGDKPRAGATAGATVTTDPRRAIEDPEVAIGIETMGPAEASYQAIAGLLAAGKHAVTANKALLAARGPELFRLAREANRTIAFEAAVGGGIPIIAALADGLASNRISALSGILNGTSNYILTAMHEEGLTYQSALAAAQAKGFAEADPTLDIDGTDAAQKLSLLARLAFGAWVDSRSIRRRGIDTFDAADIAFAKELGYVVKLIAAAHREGDRLHLQVAPTLVPAGHPMAVVRGEYNAVRVTGDAVGDVFFQGKGAGGRPTAGSVVADALGLATGRLASTFASLRLWREDATAPRFSPDLGQRSRFYLRFGITDRPGVLAQIAGVLGTHGISIASVIQHEVAAAKGSGVPLVIMTHHAAEDAVSAALAEADGLPVVLSPTVRLHVAD